MDQYGSSSLSTARSQVLGIDDLLAMIFLECLPEDKEKVFWCFEWTLDVSSDLQYPQPSEKEAPLLLTHVCRHWRQLALDTPRLWTRLFLLFDGKVIQSARLLNSQCDALSFWLDWSRSLPISIRCVRGDDFIESEPGFRSWSEPEDKYNAARKVMDLLQQHKDRWENVSIDLSEAGLVRFYEPGDHSYPLLKTLELMQPSYEVEDEGYEECKELCISSAPELQAVSLTGMQEDDYVTLPQGMPPGLRSLGLNSMCLRITQDAQSCQIRKLVLNKVELSDIALSRFPTALPQLQSFTFAEPRNPEDEDIILDDTGGNIVVLKSLTEFKVRTGPGRSFPLNRISAPNLEQLLVDECSYGFPEAPDVFDTAVLEFLDRSKAPIKTFHYTTRRRACENISAMLLKLPNLEFLDVSYPALSSAGMRLLEDTSVCPNLMGIRSAGEFVAGDADRGTEVVLDVPGAQQILRLIDARCHKRWMRRRAGVNVESWNSWQTLAGESRRWLVMLGLPMRSLHYHEVKADPIFANSSVLLMNTSKGEDDDEW